MQDEVIPHLNSNDMMFSGSEPRSLTGVLYE